MGNRSRRISPPQFKIVFRRCVGKSFQLRPGWLLFKPLKNNSHLCPPGSHQFLFQRAAQSESSCVCTASGSNPLQCGLVFPRRDKNRSCAATGTDDRLGPNRRGSPGEMRMGMLRGLPAKYAAITPFPGGVSLGGKINPPRGLQRKVTLITAISNALQALLGHHEPGLREWIACKQSGRNGRIDLGPESFSRMMGILRRYVRKNSRVILGKVMSCTGMKFCGQ